MIDLAQWRAVIGQWIPSCSRTKVRVSSDQYSRSRRKEVSFRHTVQTTKSLLILSGDVELNPGPDGVKRTLKRVFNSHNEALSHALKHCLKGVSEEMYSKDLISVPVRDAPTFDGICREFETGIDSKEDIQQLEKHCQLFLTCIASQGGPAEDMAKKLAKEWKEKVLKYHKQELSLLISSNEPVAAGSTRRDTTRSTPKLTEARQFQLDERPVVHVLMKFLRELVKWKEFASYLPEIKQSHIEEIEEEKRSVSDQKRALYKKWLDVYPKATWKDVIDALETAEQNALAEEVKEKLAAQVGGACSQVTSVRAADLTKAKKAIKQAIGDISDVSLVDTETAASELDKEVHESKTLIVSGASPTSFNTMENDPKSFRNSQQVKASKEDPHSTEVRKSVTVPVNEVRQADDDDKLSRVLHDLTMKRILPTGMKVSEMLLQDFKKCKAKFKSGSTKVLGRRFESLLHEKVQKEVISPHLGVRTVPLQVQSSVPLLNTLHTNTTSSIEDKPYLLVNASQVKQKLATLQADGVSPVGSHTPMVNFEGLSHKDIQLLSTLLLNDNGTQASHANMKSSLKAMIPQVSTIRESMASIGACSKCKAKQPQHACSQCNKHFCDKCYLEDVNFAHKPEAQPFCSECSMALDNLDAEKWMSVCMQFLKKGTIEATKTALGCLVMALCNCEDKTKPVLEVAEALNENGLPELAMPLIASALKECKTAKKLVNVYILTASVLKSSAEQPDTKWERKLELLQAAKEACLAAECSSDKSMEVPKLTSIANSINLALEELVKEKPFSLNALYQKLSDLWSVRDCKKIVEFVTVRIACNDIAIKQKTIEALQTFLLPYEDDIDKRESKSQHEATLLLLRGILKIEQKQYLSGLIDVERAAWIIPLGLSNVVIDAILNAIEFQFFSIKAFSDLCNSKSLLSICSCPGSDDRSLTLLFPQVNEMQLPFPVNWPELSKRLEEVMLNPRGCTEFENAISSQIREGKQSEWEAALAYLDYVQSCNDDDKYPLCFLYASFLFYKHLQANDSSLPNCDKYALTQMIVNCVQIAYGAATRKLAPGMKLYISRLSLSILLHTLQLTKTLATEENSDLVIHLLRSTLRFCRMFPLWEMPFVPLSEVAIFSIKVNHFQGEFLLRLQQVDQARRPVTEAELQYQIYENDILHIYPLKDPDTARAKAMEELLHEKGWSWEDVQNLMTSPLSPRDSDGWLLRRPRLGIRMEYSQLKGFMLNLDEDCPSIELFTMPANEKLGIPGLFSQEDVQTVLQLDHEECYPQFFSLDSPSEIEECHPFQKFRYEPDRLQDTNFLHTMFETDYLMKSFSIGSEVSSKPPFNQRPCREGLLKGLPHRLIQALKPTTERPGGHQEGARRYWIQADMLTYSKESSGSKVTFRLGKVEMSIRTHPLFRGPDGKLKDTKHKEDPNSPEAQFAADLTSVYDELSGYFPIFGRLRELAKLQFLGKVIIKILKDLKDSETPHEVVHKIQSDTREHHKTQVEKLLDGLSSDTNVKAWPTADNDLAISSAVDKFYNDLPYDQRLQVSRYDIESQAKSAFRDNDRNLLSAIVDGLMEKCKRKLSRDMLETHVRNWIVENNSQFNSSNRARTDLISLITSVLPVPTHDDILRQRKEVHLKRYNSFSSYVNKLKSASNSRDTKPKSSPCDWVPAALLKNEVTDTTGSLRYGGVTLNLEIKEGNVVPLPEGVQKVKIEIPYRRPQIRSCHSKETSHYCAPNAFAKPADQQPAVPPRGAMSSGEDGSNSSSGTGSGSASGSGQSGNPAATAAGAAGGGEENEPLSSFDDEDESDNDEEGNSTSYQLSIDAIQESGERGFRILAQQVNPSTSAVNTSLMEVQVLLIHGSIIDILQKEDINGKDVLTRGHFDQALYDGPFKKHNTIAEFITNEHSSCKGKYFRINIRTSINGNMCNVIYCIRCKRTGMLYIGKTKRMIKERLNEHLRNIRKPHRMKNGDKLTKLVTHFNSEGASVDEFEIIVLESTEGMTSKAARVQETKWMFKLDTLKNGLNKIRSTKEVDENNCNE